MNARVDTVFFLKLIRKNIFAREENKVISTRLNSLKEVISIDFFPGKDSCKGDSGGPLMSQRAGNLDKPKYLYGIVSFGTTNCGSVRFVVPVYN